MKNNSDNKPSKPTRRTSIGEDNPENSYNENSRPQLRRRNALIPKEYETNRETVQNGDNEKSVSFGRKYTRTFTISNEEELRKVKRPHKNKNQPTQLKPGMTAEEAVRSKRGKKTLPMSEVYARKIENIQDPIALKKYLKIDNMPEKVATTPINEITKELAAQVRGAASGLQKLGAVNQEQEAKPASRFQGIPTKDLEVAQEKGQQNTQSMPNVGQWEKLAKRDDGKSGKEQENKSMPNAGQWGQLVGRNSGSGHEKG